MAASNHGPPPTSAHHRSPTARPHCLRWRQAALSRCLCGQRRPSTARCLLSTDLRFSERGALLPARALAQLMARQLPTTRPFSAVGLAACGHWVETGLKSPKQKTPLIRPRSRRTPLPSPRRRELPRLRPAGPKGLPGPLAVSVGEGPWPMLPERACQTENPYFQRHLYLGRLRDHRRKNKSCQCCSCSDSDRAHAHQRRAAPTGAAAGAVPCVSPSPAAKGFGAGKSAILGADPSANVDRLEVVVGWPLLHEARHAAAGRAVPRRPSLHRDSSGCSSAAFLSRAWHPPRARRALALRDRGSASASSFGAAHALGLKHDQGSAAEAARGPPDCHARPDVRAGGLSPATPACASRPVHRAWGQRGHGCRRQRTTIGPHPEQAAARQLVALPAAPGGRPALPCVLLSLAAALPCARPGIHVRPVAGRSWISQGCPQSRCGR